MSPTCNQRLPGSGIRPPVARLTLAGRAMASTLQLAAGDARVAVVPAAGGSIAEFTWRGAEVLKSAAPQAVAAGDVLAMASYPLVPYSNRIAAGRLAFDGASHALRRNLGDHPHAIHGVGWQRPWEVREHAAARVVLELLARRRRLRRAGLALAVSRRAGVPPCGDRRAAPCSPRRWRSRTPARGASPAASAGTRSSRATRRPGSRSPPPASGRPTPRGSRPPACARSPGASRPCARSPTSRWTTSSPAGPERSLLQQGAGGLAIRLGADAPCRHLVVYTPGDGRSIALEPVTHVTDAFNRAARDDADTGMLVLDPGARIACTMRIDVSLAP